MAFNQTRHSHFAMLTLSIVTAYDFTVTKQLKYSTTCLQHSEHSDETRDKFDSSKTQP